MKSLEIKGTKLKLTRISSWRKGDSSIYFDPDLKSRMRYQELIFMNLDSSPRKSDIMSTTGLSGLLPVESKYQDFSEVWVLERLAKKSEKTDEYSDEEEKLIYTYLAAILKYHVPVVESLLQSTQNKMLLQTFYESYGNLGLGRLKTELLFDYPKRRRISASVVSEYSPIYQRTRRYGVVDLVNDLVREKVQILTDPELLKKYVPITQLRETNGEFIYSDWSQVINKRGNRTRANLSLVFKGKVEVTIPENAFGVEPGVREFEAHRAYCIIKDGVLWTPELAIKTQNKKLINKLKSTGCVKDGLVFEDEYLLDLTKLPVVNREGTKKSTVDSILIPEINVRLALISKSYLGRLKWMKGEGLSKWPEAKPVEEEPTDKEKFLQSLGIYGNVYRPTTTSGPELGFVYRSIEVIKKVGIPENYGHHLVHHINDGKCKNEVIENQLSLVDAELKSGKTIDELMAKYEEMARENREVSASKNFNLVMTKNLVVDDSHKNSSIDRGDTYVRDVLIGTKHVQASFVLKEIENKV